MCSVFQVKCDHYWPFTDEPVMYGEISVEMLSESESPEWTVRKFRLGYVRTFPGVSAVPPSTTRGHSNTLLWSLSPPAGRWESGRPPPELHLVARSWCAHSERHREHPTVRPHRSPAGQPDQGPHCGPLQVRLGLNTNLLFQLTSDIYPDSGTVVSYELAWLLTPQSSYCLFD